MGGSMIHSSFVTQFGEGEPFNSCRRNGQGFYVSHPPFSLSPHTLSHGNSDRAFPTLHNSSPMMRYFSSLGGFSLSDYNITHWDGCTFMFSKPPYFFRHFDASAHLSLNPPGLLQFCNSNTKKWYNRLLHFLRLSYINLPNV